MKKSIISSLKSSNKFWKFKKCFPKLTNTNKSDRLENFTKRLIDCRNSNLCKSFIFLMSSPSHSTHTYWNRFTHTLYIWIDVYMRKSQGTEIITKRVGLVKIQERPIPNKNDILSTSQTSREHWTKKIRRTASKDRSVPAFINVPTRKIALLWHALLAHIREEA